MKLLSALLVGALLASANGMGLFLKSGKQYTYETEQSVTSGTMDYATAASGLSYKCTTKIQVSGNTLNVEFSNVRFSQYVGMHDARTHPFDQTTYTPINEGMKLSINLNSDGLFESVSVPSGLSALEKNLVKSWAAQLQADTKQIKAGSKNFKSKEKVLQGDCDITYTVSSNAVRKSVSHTDDCDNRVFRIVDDYRGMRCDGKTQQNGMGYPSSTANTVFALEKDGSGFKVTKFVSTSTFIAQFFEEEGSAQFIFSNSTNNLVSIDNSPGDISASGETITDLAYEFNDKEYKWNVDRDLKAVEPLFTVGRVNEDDPADIVSGIKKGLVYQKEIIKNLGNGNKDDLEKAHRYGINNILPALMSLDYNNLKSLAEEFLNDKSDTGVTTSNVFNELLASVGTTAAAMVVRDLVLENKFDNDRDAARVLTGVPFHLRRSNTQLVKEYEKLMDMDKERFTKMAVPLVLGHLIRVTCVRAGNPLSEESKECFDTFARSYVNKLWKRYQGSSDEEEKTMVLSAMTNIRFGGQSDVLKPVIDGKVESNPRLRAMALWAAGWENLYLKKGIESNLPIFSDPAYPAELRIGALEMLMWASPSPAVMNTITAVLYREKNYEVLNYAMALFERWAGNLNPCAEKTGHLAKFYLKYIKQWSNYETDFGFGVSKTYSRQFQKKKYGYGGGYTFYTIGAEDSTTPLVIGMGITQSMMNNYMSFMAHAHIRIEGVAKGLIRKFKKTDPTTWKTADLENILSGEMGIRERPDQPIRAQIILYLKGVIILQRIYNEDDGGKSGKFASFVENFKNLGDSYSINHQRGVQVGAFLYEQPTGIGLPMAVMSGTTWVGSIKATVKRGNHRGLLYRNVEYDIKTLCQSVRGAFVLNPFRKAAFGIVNDRIYHARIPRKIVIGVNPIKKELKLSVSRPEYDDPMKLFMHSQTSVIVRGGNLRGTYDGLKNNCPTCENRVLITKGPSFVKSRTFIDRENTNRGSYLRGEYFDCEMNINRGNTVGHLLGAFMPYNKSPRTLWTSVMMGLRQIRAFFFYFPKTEQCGAMLRWSQSKTNPVKEIEITIRSNTEKNGERLFFRGRKIFLKALIKAKGEPADRTYRVNLAYEFTPGYLNNKLKLQVNRAGVPELSMDPYTLCFLLENEYPAFSKEFMGYDENADMSVSGKALVQYGKGSTCSDTEGEIRLKFKHSTTQEARDELKNKWYYQKCMESKNSPAWSGRSYALPVTEPCYMTLWDATNARKYTWKVNFVKLTKRLESFLTKVQTIGKAGLLPYWDIDPDDVDDNSNGIGPFMNLDVTLKNDERNADVIIETRRGTETFDNVPLRLNWSKRLRNLKFTKTLKRLFDAKIIAPCIATNSYIRTMDNVTYNYEPSNCWTLASAGCGPTPSYAVFTKKVGGSKPVGAMVYVGGHSAEFIPSGNSVTVKINGATKDISEGTNESVSQDGVEIFQIYKWGNTYNLYSFLRVWVTYDGNFLEVVPAPSTKGQHCGLCGNYNRNKWDEFTGKNNQQLTSAADMVSDWKWKC